MGKKWFLPKWRVCQKCAEKHYCETHYVHPREYFGENKDGSVELCGDCHTGIHWLLSILGRLMNKRQFDIVTKRWFKGLVNDQSDVYGIFMETSKSQPKKNQASKTFEDYQKNRRQ